MLPDPQLLEFTAGVRGRIAFAVAVGLAAAVVGIARYAALGWLIAGVFAEEPFEALAGKFVLVGAIMLLRGWLEYWRNMIAHRTAARVQMHLRERLYDKVTELGPAWFGLERTGKVLVSIVEGVEQLETWFGQFLPQLCVAALTPIVVFAFLAFLDLPVALVLLAFALFTLFAPAAFTRWDRANSRRRQRAYSGFAAEFLDTLQGLATLKAFGQSGTRGRRLAARAEEVFRTTMWVLAVNSLGRGITDVGLAVGAAVVLGYGAFRVEAGAMGLAELLIVLMMGIEVFRPQRDLRALLHQGLVGMAAADGILSLLAGRPIVEYSAAKDSGRGEEIAPTVEFEAVAFTYPGARRPAHRGLDFRIDAGGADRFRRGERGREDVDRPPPPSPLRPGRGVGPHWRTRRPSSLRPRRARENRGRQPGHHPPARHGRGQPALRQARRHPRGARRRGASGECARVHRAAAGGLPDGGRGARGCGSPAGSGSESRSPAPSSVTRPSSCWTRR